MSKERDWCKLGESWHANKKIRRLTRRFGPVAGGYLALIIARTYNASHHKDNPTGVVRCALQDLKDDLYDRHDRQELFEAMVDAKLIRIRGKGWKTDPSVDVRLEMVDFTDWQWPKGSSAKRSAEERERKKRNQKSVEVAGKLDASGRSAVDCAQKKKKKKKKKKTLGTNVPMSTGLAADVRSVFDHWVATAAPLQVADPSRVRLTQDRAAKIKARLADHSVAELCQCIDGFVSDPHHRGENDRNTPYLDFSTIFRNATKVDAGIRHATSGASAAGSSEAARLRSIAQRQVPA